MKSELAVLTLTQKASYKEQSGGTNNVMVADFAEAFGGDKSATRSTLRSLAAILRKTKNTNCPNCYCFFYIGVTGLEGNTSRTYMEFPMERRLISKNVFFFSNAQKYIKQTHIFMFFQALLIILSMFFNVKQKSCQFKQL